MTLRLLILIGSLLGSSAAFAHDTWVEVNTNLIRTGDAVYVDLRLGNHGNAHRDFKLASKIDLDACTLGVQSPDGRTLDICHDLVDTGYAPQEGYWCGKFTAARPGLYIVSHTLDNVVNHGHPVRAIKSGKTFFVASDRLDDVPMNHPGFETVFGHPLELVPTVNPVTPMGPGQPISVRLLFKGQPLQDMRVSFVPRRDALKEGFDERYERNTDVKGQATFTPKTGDQYLIVAHYEGADEGGEDYDKTIYSATLTVFVPEVCPCCGD
jgi:uncharacterized GH25 family protein